MMLNWEQFKKYYLFLSIIAFLFILFTVLLATGAIEPHIGSASKVKARVDWSDYEGNSGDYVIAYC